MKPDSLPLNAALWRDLENRLGTCDLLDWLEKEAERVASLGRTQSGPIAFSAALLRDRNVALIRTKPYLPALQTIELTARGYEICCNPFQRRIEDQRFGIAHEIAHTFWFAPGTSGQPLSPLQRAIGDDPTIEWLCNRGAAAILLPRTDLSAVLNEKPVALHEIPLLAKRYLVPERLVARRIFHELAGEDFSMLAVRTQRTNGTQPHGAVTWFAPAPGRRVVKTIQSRVVPLELLPELPIGRTREVELDGRWWVLAESALSRDRATPLEQCAHIDASWAWAGRTADAWYLALPSIT